MVGIDLPWVLDWCSVYSARAMTLPDYVHQRILFTGDAAHMLPIFGVRGANTGLQDCQNLTWKLSLVIKALARSNLLASYSHERVNAAREIIGEASKSTRFMAPPDRGYRLVRDAVLSLSLIQAFVRPLFHWRTSRPHDYHDSPLNALQDDNACFGTGPANGAPLQNIKFGVDDYLFDHLQAGFTLLYFTDQTVPSTVQAAVAAVQARGIPLQLLVVNTPHAAQRYGTQTGSAYLARPDQHVCARWLQLEASQLLPAIQQAIGQGEPA